MRIDKLQCSERQLATLTKKSKPLIKVIENRQIVPPRSERDREEKDLEWTEVIRKDKKKKNHLEEKKELVIREKKQPSKKEKAKAIKRRIPKTAAISIKGKSENFFYAEALKKARTEISLEDMEINSPKIRKGMNGATIIEIFGDDNSKKADELARKIQSILKDEAHVTRPKIKGEIKLIGLDESIIIEEIIWIALEGDCCSEDVKVNSTRTTRTGESHGSSVR